MAMAHAQSRRYHATALPPQIEQIHHADVTWHRARGAAVTYGRNMHDA